MLDPWFPVALILIALFASWLSIFGPISNGFGAWLHDWQTLVAALVAIVAAGVAFHNTTRSLNQAEELEKRRRSRKLAAIRAVLPLALAKITEYAARSARNLDRLVEVCVGRELPPNSAQESLITPLPSETLKALTEFIEYSDEIDISIAELTVGLIQIHDARIRDLIDANRDQTGQRGVAKESIMGCVIDAASIYAAASAMFGYARQFQNHLPTTVSWEYVNELILFMPLDQDYEPLINQRQKFCTGPFEMLNQSRPQRSSSK